MSYTLQALLVSQAIWEMHNERVETILLPKWSYRNVPQNNRLSGLFNFDSYQEFIDFKKIL